MDTIEQIGLGFMKLDSDLSMLDRILNTFPSLPCYKGPLKIKDGACYDFSILWEYKKPNNGNWTVADFFVDHFFIDNYKILDSLCKKNQGATLFSTDELGEIFRYGPFDSNLSLDFLLIDKKEHNQNSTLALKQYIKFIFEKYEQKSVAYFCMLDLLNKNPELEDGLVPFIELYHKEIHSLIRCYSRNQNLLTEIEIEKYRSMLENIQVRTKATAIRLSPNNRDNYLSCWRTERNIK